MLSRCILSSCPFVCLSVRPSVKVSIDKQRITETKWYNSAKLEVFCCCQRSHWNSDGVTSNVGAKYSCAQGRIKTCRHCGHWSSADRQRQYEPRSVQTYTGKRKSACYLNWMNGPVEVFLAQRSLYSCTVMTCQSFSKAVCSIYWWTAICILHSTSMIGGPPGGRHLVGFGSVHCKPVNWNFKEFLS